MRLEVAERRSPTAPCARPSTGGDERRRAIAPRARRRGRRHRLHQRLSPMPENERARRRGGARRSGPTSNVAISLGDPAGDPRIRAELDDGAQRLSAARRRLLSRQARGCLAAGGFRGDFHIVQSNGGVMATSTARRLPVRTALSGPAAGVIAAGRDRARGRPLECDHRRSGRHLLRRVADRGWPNRTLGADHHRLRPRHPHAR